MRPPPLAELVARSSELARLVCVSVAQGIRQLCHRCTIVQLHLRCISIQLARRAFAALRRWLRLPYCSVFARACGLLVTVLLHIALGLVCCSVALPSRHVRLFSDIHAARCTCMCNKPFTYLRRHVTRLKAPLRSPHLFAFRIHNVRQPPQESTQEGVNIKGNSSWYRGYVITYPQTH